MKLWLKALIAAGAVLVITVTCTRIAAPELLGIGYPNNVPKPPLSYRIKWLLGNKPNYTVERRLPDGTVVQVDAGGRAAQDKQTEAAEKAVSSIKPEDFQTVDSFVRQAHFWLNDLVASGHYKRFTDSSTWASSSREYLWETRVKEYVSGEGEMNPSLVGTVGLSSQLHCIAAMGMLFVIWGVAVVDVWPTLLGSALVHLAKLWFLERMVWLYEEMKDVIREYHEWLY